MNDLKTALGKLSNETRFTVWVFTESRARCSRKIAQVERMTGVEWAKMILRRAELILYIAVVDPKPDSGFCSRVTIFRHPGKQWLNEIVQSVADLNS